MDAEHRHELKTNELADWIVHVPEFLRKYAKVIVAAVLIAAALVVLKYALSAKSEAATMQLAQATSLIERLQRDKIIATQPRGDGLGGTDGILETARQLETTAGLTSDPATTALVLIRRGDALRAELHYRQEIIAPDAINTAITQARAVYEQAIEKAKGAPNEAQLVAMANLGLALCDEEVGELDKAAQTYQEIIADEQLKGSILPMQAKLRLAAMEDSKGSFVFPKAPKPAAAPAPSALPMPLLPEPVPVAPTVTVTPEPAPAPAQPTPTPDSAPADKPAGEAAAPAPVPAPVPATPEPAREPAAPQPK